MTDPRFHPAPASAPAFPLGDAAGFRALAETMPQLVWSTTPDGYHDFYNARWYEYTGMPRGGEQGWNWKTFLHPDDFDRAVTVWTHSLQTGEPYEIEYRFRRAADGAYRWFLGRALPARDERGRIRRWFGTCTDIDDARRDAAAAGVLADAGDALVRALDVDDAVRAVARVAVPRLADWCAVDLVEGDSMRRVAIEHRDPAKLALAHELERRYPLDPRSTDGVAQVLRSGASQLRVLPDDLRAVVRDEEQLRLLTALGLRSYVIAPILRGTDGGPGPDQARQVLGTITLVAAETGRHLGHAEQRTAEELGRRVASAIERARMYRAAIDDRFRLAEQTAELERQNEHLHEQAAELETQTEQLQEQAGELEMQSAQLQEQAAEMEMANDELFAANGRLAESEERLRHALLAEQGARREAEQANRAKSDFLATMSHELRTPLNAILGYADLLSFGVRGSVTTDQHEDLDRIKRSGQHLLSLINDILNYAKVEAGRVEYCLTSVALQAELADLESLIRPHLRARTLSYEHVACAPTLLARADRDKLRQIVLNLLGNSVKYTPAGGRIEVRCEEDGDRVAIRVRDTGIGIPADKLATIFDPFVQVDRSLNRPAEGVGLGLAISRDLARGMGGDLTATSALGRGSEFTLVLPGA